MSLTPIYLYKFVNGDQTFTFTNVGSEQTLDDDIYAPENISHASPDITADISSANIKIRVPFDNDVVALHSPFPSPSDTLVYIYKFYEGVTDPELQWQGKVINTEFDDPWVSIACNTTLASLDIEGNPETNQNLCNYVLGDGRCPVNLEHFRTGITVTVISGLNVTVTGITQIDNYFKGGTFKAPNNDWRQITGNITVGPNKVLTLDNAFAPETLAVGDTADIYPGCDRAQATCITKFGTETGNGAAFGGNPIQANINPHEYGKLL